MTTGTTKGVGSEEDEDEEEVGDIDEDAEISVVDILARFPLAAIFRGIVVSKLGYCRIA